MKPFVTLSAAAAPYLRSSIDTNTLVPHRFVRKSLSPDYGSYLFFE